jgi:ankyrin repeat protein
VQVGQQVCALGRYDAAKRALVPRGATLNRLWPGTLDAVRRDVVGTARSQTLLGLSFFLVTHAMLGLAFYMSETRHSRETDDRQASVIRSAVQDNDVEALERAVRRGANPNARDSFDAVLLDVRDPAIAAALIRLGADVNVRAREGGDTLLIRAAGMGNGPLVTVLLAAGAHVHVENAMGATALSEAIRGGHDDVAALLRAAGATSDGVQLESPRRPSNR